MPLIIVLTLLAGANLWVTRKVLRSDEFTNRKALLIAGIWIMPVMGALIAKNHLPVPATPQGLAPGRPALPLPEGFLSEPAPMLLHSPHAEAFDVALHLEDINGIPLLDWAAHAHWTSSMPDENARNDAAHLAQRAWLLHLRDALGPHFHLYEGDQAQVLSSLEPGVVMATARYVATTRTRIGRVLPDVARFPAGRKSALVILDSEEDYYHYVSTYYPGDGEFAFSGGMFVDFGCPHFVAKRADLSAIEPVIAHEMTHSALSYLRLPAWLDEGIAVNTEHRLAGAQRSIYTPQELRAMHRRFWTLERIQEFWSGESFHRTDEGNLLSYELARIMVEHMGRDWASFSSFVASATRADAGAAAAQACLSTDLGACVCALLEHETTQDWSPLLAATATAASPDTPG